jgi:ribulose-phosphate 3-epimerase
MDGHFVPNLSFGPHHLIALKKEFPDLLVDTHLMVYPSSSFVTMFAQHGPNRLNIHPESTFHLHRELQLIKSAKNPIAIKAGVVLNPGTGIEKVEEVKDLIDLILVMGVNPGFGGQVLIESTFDKIKRVRRWIDGVARPINLAVDGGMTLMNVDKAIESGADTIIVGNDFFAQVDGWRQWIEHNVA